MIPYLTSQVRTIPLTIVDLARANDDINNFKNKVIYNSVKSDVVGTIVDIFGKMTNNAKIGSTGAGNVLNYINQIASGIMAESNITEDSLSYYRFRINPQKMNVPKQKIQTRKYTGGGWNIDTFGHEPIVYSYSGTTGSMVPKNFWNTTVQGLVRNITSQLGLSPLVNAVDQFINIPELSENPKLSDTYLKFLLFDKFWQMSNNALLIIFEDNAYVGKFNNFKYNMQEKEPYQIFYDFDFVVYPDFQYNLYTGWISQNDFDQIKKVFLRSSSQYFNANNFVIPDKNTTTTDEQDLWYATVGAYPYNKDKREYLSKKFNNIKSTNFLNLTPRDLSNLFKENTYIDIFEDSIDPNLKFPVNVLTRIEQQQTSIEVNSTVIKESYNNEYEQEIGSGNYHFN